MFLDMKKWIKKLTDFMEFNMISEIKYWCSSPFLIRIFLLNFRDKMFKKFLPKTYAAKNLARVQAPRRYYNERLVANQTYYRNLPTPDMPLQYVAD